MIKQTLYFGNPARLSVSNNQLAIELQGAGEEEARHVSRPLEDIGILVLDSPQISLTMPVLRGLMESGAAVVVCDRSHIPSGLMLPMEGHSLQSERFRVQSRASLPLKKQLWQQTVVAKINNQRAVLEWRTGEKLGNMRAWARDVRSGDSDNLEARAAAYYWRNMFKDVPATGRDPDGDEPNSMLNYGYAIVRAVIARALVASGLHPTMGIFHRNKYNAYCLADDIMEPYRPYVDRLVMEILDENPCASILGMATKRRLLSIPTIDVVIDGVRHPLMTAAAETAASLFKCYDGTSRRIRYPEM